MQYINRLKYIVIATIGSISLFSCSSSSNILSTTTTILDERNKLSLKQDERSKDALYHLDHYSEQ